MSRKTRKLIWSAPLVAVLAVAGALAIFAALAPSGAQAAHVGLPSVVTNLEAEADGSRAIDVSWDAPSGSLVDGYRIDRSKDGNVWVTDQTNHQGTTYTNGGLKAGDTYYYRVFAVNLVGTGPVSTDVLAQTDFAEAPGTIRSLLARATDQNTIELSWRAPTDDGGADIVRYHIHFASDGETIPAQGETAVVPADPGLLHTDGPVTTYDHEDLVAGTRYRYQVYAVNDDNLKSANPGDTEAATTHDLDKPGAPTVLRAVQTDE